MKMAPSKLRKAIGAVKDQTSIGLAKVRSSNSISDLEVAIVKATLHQETPPSDRCIREIINLTTYSRTMVAACVTTIARRLNRTKNWVVALKSLMLIHRLLCDGDRAYEQEIFFSTRRGTRFLNMSDFRDSSGKSDAWDYSAFVRTYALYLDERLEFRMQSRRGKRGGGFDYQEEEEEEAEEGAAARATPIREMKIENIFSMIHHLKQLLERFLACRPRGKAKHDRVVAVALYPIVKESFQIGDEITEIMATLVERFMRLQIPDMVRVYEVFCQVSKQYDELNAFYNWCKSVGIMRALEFPDVETIPQRRLDLMDDYIHQKSAILRTKSSEQKPINPKPVEEDKKEVNLFAVKALPPPEAAALAAEETETCKEEKKETELFINLSEDAPINTQEQENKLALALFDGGPATTAPPPWEAFKYSSGENWETALVQSVSHLSNQKANLPKGFDAMTLDGLYQHGAMAQAAGFTATGSASSVVTLRPTVLALPAGNGGGGDDPFAASAAVPPPPYVQMADMAKKQRLLLEEQVGWQQYYARNVQHSDHNVTGGYTHKW